MVFFYRTETYQPFKKDKKMFHYEKSMIWIWDGVDGEKDICIMFSLSVQMWFQTEYCLKKKPQLINRFAISL